MKRFSPFTGMQVRQGTVTLLLAVLLASGWLLMHPAPASGVPPVSGVPPFSGVPPQAGWQAAPTPAPQTAQPANTRSVSPIIGIMILLAPLVFLVWRSRGKKQPDIQAASCLPVIDESKRPFQILDEAPAAGKPQKPPKS